MGELLLSGYGALFEMMEGSRNAWWGWLCGIMNVLK
jgi:hypothetical protein